MRQLAFDVFTRADKVLRVVIVLFNTGSNREDVRVEDDVFRREAHLFGQNFVCAATNLNFARAGIGLAHFIEGHHHHGGTITAHHLRVVDKGINAFFHRDGVNNAFTLNTLQPFLDDFPLRGVNHDWHPGNVRLTGYQVEEAHHRRFGVEHSLIHIDVDDLGAALNLLAGHVKRFTVLLFFNQPFEFRRTGHVSPLPDVHKQAVITDGQRLKTGQTAGNRQRRQLTRRQTRHRIAHRGNMLWRGTAATTDDIQKTGFGPLADLRRHGVCIQIVFTKGVRQAGVRVCGDIAFSDARKFLHILAQLIGTQRAVQAESERFSVTQGVVKSFCGLAGEGTTRGIGDGTGNHDRQVDAQRLELLFHRVNRGFGIEGVEYRFNQDQIGTAFHQRFGRFTIRRHQLIKADVTKGRVVYIG